MTPIAIPCYSLANGAASNDHTHHERTAQSEAVEQLRQAMIEELCALRFDVDIIKQGGWQVKVGPFQHNINDKILPDPLKIRQGITGRITAKTANVLSAETASSTKSPALIKPASLASSSFIAQQDTGQNQASFTVLDYATEGWKPSFIRFLTPLEDPGAPDANTMVTFSWDFIQTLFKGATEHSPGLYHIPTAVGGSILPSRTFYAVDLTTEPFLPLAPGGHGAKLTPFFSQESPAGGHGDAYEKVPLFVSASTWGGKTRRANEYVYYGMYSQTRWSDKLSCDEIRNHVPQNVKQYWAEQLADPSRPEWLTKELMKHLVPMPQYDGALPISTPNGSSVVDDDEKIKKRMQKDLKNFTEELQLWENEARVQVCLMKPKDMLESFEKADADETPGLRLWWEYLECKQWDTGFYEMLVHQQSKLGNRR